MKPSKFRIGDEVKTKPNGSGLIGKVLEKQLLIHYHSETSFTYSWYYYIERSLNNTTYWFQENGLELVN